MRVKGKREQFHENNGYICLLQPYYVMLNDGQEWTDKHVVVQTAAKITFTLTILPVDT